MPDNTFEWTDDCTDELEEQIQKFRVGRKEFMETGDPDGAIREFTKSFFVQEKFLNLPTELITAAAAVASLVEDARHKPVSDPFYDLGLTFIEQAAEGLVSLSFMKCSDDAEIANEDLRGFYEKNFDCLKVASNTVLATLMVFKPDAVLADDAASITRFVRRLAENAVKCTVSQEERLNFCLALAMVGRIE